MASTWRCVRVSDCILAWASLPLFRVRRRFLIFVCCLQTFHFMLVSSFSIVTFLIVLNVQLKMGFFHWKAQRWTKYLLAHLFQFISEHLLSTRILGDIIKILRPQQQTRPKCSRPSCSDLSPLPVFSLSASVSVLLFVSWPVWRNQPASLPFT